MSKSKFSQKSIRTKLSKSGYCRLVSKDGKSFVLFLVSYKSKVSVHFFSREIFTGRWCVVASLSQVDLLDSDLEFTVNHFLLTSDFSYHVVLII